VSDQLEFANLWLEDATGTPVDMEPISRALVAAASTNAVPRVTSDDTLELASLVAGTDITITHGAGTITIASTASGGGGGLASPDDPPASPNTEDDEFDSASLDAKWTQTLSNAPTIDIDTDWPSHYVMQAASGAIRSAEIEQAYAPAGDFALTFKAVGLFSLQDHVVDLWIEEADDSDGFLCQYLRWTDTTVRARFVEITGGGGTFNEKGNINVAGDAGIDQLYVHYQRVGTSNSMWYSLNGRAFRLVGAFTKSYTPTKFHFRLYSPDTTGGQWMGIDWVRRDWMVL
jgi:hypothetical protein